MTLLIIPEFKGEYAFLSNFYRKPIKFSTRGGPKSFPTAEHAFQASKYKAMGGDLSDHEDYVTKVMKATTPTTARTIGKSAPGLIIDTWDQMKIPVMREILMEKFAGNEMRDLLLATESAMLVEGNTWGDQFWGRCDKKGYNMLGVLLMEVRGYLRITNPPWRA